MKKDKEIIESKEPESDTIILGKNCIIKNEENNLILQTNKGIIYKFDKKYIKHILFTY
jgi:hypothetical protein